MNILRLIGQNALIGKDAPLRHAAKRRRMKTVMQEIMFKAGRMIKHAGRWVLGLGANGCAPTPALRTAVSGSVEVARASATVVEKVDCVQQFLQWPMGSPNTYNSGAPGTRRAPHITRLNAKPWW